MSDSSKHQTRRTTEYAVRNLLQRHGYEVVRVTERQGALPAMFHLVAWNDARKILFIRIGSPRMHRDSIRNEFASLIERIKGRQYPGEIQYWISENNKWNRYLICSGGAFRIIGGLT
ncbi:MAG: hypothetical protein LUQ50_04470 [Methanospirillum sp.]|uniref:hypothetical protein n=1 Tax=Methanospirillum sp. TaxID=45200 RepID=UPI00236AB4F0|nr:hypothetical protein [Methanospirillum sp.]MDD1728310.1 hypothetical protein [Methanospirillum sp.]